MRLRPYAYWLLLFFSDWSYLAIGLTNELNSRTTTSAGLAGVVTDQSKAVAGCGREA